MNANELEQLLLLEQSGELSPAQRRRLDAALAASPEARRLRDRLRRISAAIPAPAARPAPDAAARIAARLRKDQAPARAFRPAWKPALAAAALALLVGVRTFHAPAPVSSESAAAAAEEEDWTDPLDAEFTELENLLLAISSGDSIEITEL